MLRELRDGDGGGLEHLFFQLTSTRAAEGNHHVHARSHPAIDHRAGYAPPPTDPRVGGAPQDDRHPQRHAASQAGTLGLVVLALVWKITQLDGGTPATFGSSVTPTVNIIGIFGPCWDCRR